MDTDQISRTKLRTKIWPIQWPTTAKNRWRDGDAQRQVSVQRWRLHFTLLLTSTTDVSHFTRRQVSVQRWRLHFTLLITSTTDVSYFTRRQMQGFICKLLCRSKLSKIEVKGVKKWNGLADCCVCVCVTGKYNADCN